MPNELKVKASVPGAKQATGEIKGIHDAVTRLQKGGAKGFAIGAGAAATTLAFRGVGMAIGAVTDFLGDSAGAFIEEQKSISGLNASLKANIPYWDGQTKAIERVLGARMALGFSDDEQRESLKRLLVATHDVNKALAIQRTAMDLARFKNIDLGAATDALIKVEGGQYRALKGLGIVLKEGATQTEALAAVQAAAAGAADAYAQTIEGKLTVAQVKMNEAQEKLGKGLAELQGELLPAAADAVDFLANTLTNASLAEDSVTEAFKHFREQGIEPTIDQVKEYARQLYLAKQAEDAYKFGIGGAALGTNAFKRAVDLAADPTRDLGDAMDDTKKDADELKDKIGDLTDEMNDLFDAAERPGRLQDIRDRIRDLRVEVGKTTDKGDIKIMTGDLISLYEDGFALAQKNGPRAAIDFLQNWREDTAKTDKKTLALIDSLLRLQRVAGRLEGMTFPTHHGVTQRRRAAGGPVEGGEAYTVGEHGEETFVPDRDGTIIPHGPTSPTGGGGAAGSWGGGNVYLTVSTPVLTPGGAEALARAIGPALGTYMRGRGWISG